MGDLVNGGVLSEELWEDTTKESQVSLCVSQWISILLKKVKFKES